MNMNIMLIGGAGFIGRFVAEHLEKLGHRLTLFHRTKSPNPRYIPLCVIYNSHIGGKRTSEITMIRYLSNRPPYKVQYWIRQFYVWAWFTGKTTLTDDLKI